MKQVQVKYWITILITSLSAVLVLNVNMAQPIQNKKFFEFPLVIDGWKGKDIPMGDYVYKSMTTPYLFLRDYYSSAYKVPVNLSIVWFDDRNIDFHSPEACLGGVGNTVKVDTTEMVSLEGKRYKLGKLITELEGRRQVVLYFFDVDGHVTLSQTELRLRILARRLAFKRASASFVRLMVPITTDEQDAKNILLNFLYKIFPLLPSYTYTNMIGAALLNPQNLHI